MSFLGGLFGGSGDSSSSNTKAETVTGTGTGLVSSGTTGNVTYTTNDPSIARDALQANAYVADLSLTGLGEVTGKALDVNQNVVQFALSNALDAVKSGNKANTDILAQTQDLYYKKIADNAGVAPQTIQTQATEANAALLKTGLIILGGVIAVGLVVYSLKKKA